MPTVNYYIAPNDGWVQVAAAPDFVRVTGYPYTHQYYLAAGSSAPSEVPTAATGEMTISGAPTDGDTVTIGSEVYTFADSVSGSFEVEIGGDATETGANFEAVVNADSTLVTADAVNGVVTFTSNVTGPTGNYAMSENATNVTIDATMTGGADVTYGIAMCHKPFECNVTMTENLYARTVTHVANSNRMDGKLRLDVFTVV